MTTNLTLSSTLSISRACIGKLLVNLLFVFFLFFAKQAQSQQAPVPLTGFECTLSNSTHNLHMVMPCMSIVTASISLPSLIDTVQLTFPNTFEIVSVTGSNSLPNPTAVPAMPIGLTAIDTGRLISQTFVPNSGVDTLIVVFGYRNCDVYQLSNAANTHQLYFACDNGATPLSVGQHYASMSMASGAIWGTFPFNNSQIFQVNPFPAQNNFPALIWFHGGNPSPLIGNNQSVHFREFSVRFYGSVTQFQLHISDELDVTEDSLMITSSLGDSVISPNTGQGNFNIDLSNNAISQHIASV
jgi:hypothetical protein